MNYIYEFKDTKLENFFCTLFDKTELLRLIRCTLISHPEWDCIFISPTEKSSPDYLKPKFNVFCKGCLLTIPKDQILITPVYDPYDWNPYPEVTPPEGDKKFLVQLADNDIRLASFYQDYGPEGVTKEWRIKNSFYKEEDFVVAFREPPEFFVKNSE